MYQRGGGHGLCTNGDGVMAGVLKEEGVLA